MTKGRWKEFHCNWCLVQHFFSFVFSRKKGWD